MLSQLIEILMYSKLPIQLTAKERKDKMLSLKFQGNILPERQMSVKEQK